ncbi:hypothetical protein HBH98_106620 [Parastagonospora nodorum]|nr:hypothetical protein HBH54_133330 [Parastagonospora nodorum]KAH3950643.1 hypothetical protein HBH53_073630 [Parastagonospora nodorum]KAH4024212.1 hypothetical protein HBI13_084380 [Parastagonospora nodorum]KAH4033936.1 hypothetical protein HBI09_114670 [Parastagonospora nodorum]KAH4046488.1 hypothetical protein HBH49_184030 [Parastagonospora nodorum]
MAADPNYNACKVASLARRMATKSRALRHNEKQYSKSHRVAAAMARHAERMGIGNIDLGDLQRSGSSLCRLTIRFIKCSEREG